VSKWHRMFLNPGWDIWEYERNDMVTRISLVKDGVVKHRIDFDNAIPRNLILDDMMDALKEHGALKERDT
jgi:hypothetical protein